MPVKGYQGSLDEIHLESLPDPEDRFVIENIIGSGISGTVYEATDNEQGIKVALKIQLLLPQYVMDVKEEYRLLKELSDHPNLPKFYGAFYKNREVWFAIEMCEGGTAIDLSRKLTEQNKHLSERHMSYILREVIRAICHLHGNHVMHRDIKGRNIVITNDGLVKLVDFGLSRGMDSTLDKRLTCVGSPCWMAPELILSGKMTSNNEVGYDNRIDVWALGVTAIELAESTAPFEGIHPTRAIFQIVRNPPPNFRYPSKWSQEFLDFVAECLVKNPEERPFIFEFTEHPFFEPVANDDGIPNELALLVRDCSSCEPLVRKSEFHLRSGKIQRKQTEPSEAMLLEDLAALDEVTEESVMEVLSERFKKGLFYTFAGDVLLFINPGVSMNIFGLKYHNKYKLKSRSDHSPHIYGLADVAYQDMLHHRQPQHFVLNGESCSGKTANYNHLIEQMVFLGKRSNKTANKILAAKNIVSALGNAGTAENPDSTRHVNNAQITFTSTGLLSGAIFWVYQLEKWRISDNRTYGERNFHIFYYFYDSMRLEGRLEDFFLEGGEDYAYLNREWGTLSQENEENRRGASGNPKVNAEKFKNFWQDLITLEFETSQMEAIQKILAAILLLGQVTFKNEEDGFAAIENPEMLSKVSALLGVDERKFGWALCNYCVVEKGEAVIRKFTVEEAIEAKHVLARGLYSRFVDFLVDVVNLKLSLTRVVLGDTFYISVLDIPGFENKKSNGLEQLFINVTNEQLQHFYTHRIFEWELAEQEKEGILQQAFQYYDNKPTVQELMDKPDGLMYLIDEACRSSGISTFVCDTLANTPTFTRVKKATSTDFSVFHYSQKVIYEARSFPSKNRDFLSAEMIETLRAASEDIVKQMFTNPLTKAGNLTIATEQMMPLFAGKMKKWSSSLISGSHNTRKFNTTSNAEYSQTRRVRTACTMYRGCISELLKSLSDSSENCKLRFVRCIRSGEVGNEFQENLVAEQVRSLAIVDTTRARQIGYSYRVSFEDFIESYKFLAFDFEENVEISRENCRLLLIRLKMEGWIIGKTKVFLRYYDEEYLSRLYETQVKKIIKIQAVMRKFLTKRKVIPRIQSQQSMAYTDEDRTKIVRKYFERWRGNSIFHVLIQYRAVLFQDFSYFSQQAHIYNKDVYDIINRHKRFENPTPSKVQVKSAKEFLGRWAPIPMKSQFYSKNQIMCVVNADMKRDKNKRLPENQFAPKRVMFTNSGPDMKEDDFVEIHVDDGRETEMNDAANEKKMNMPKETIRFMFPFCCFRTDSIKSQQRSRNNYEDADADGDGDGDGDADDGEEDVRRQSVQIDLETGAESEVADGAYAIVRTKGQAHEAPKAKCHGAAAAAVRFRVSNGDEGDVVSMEDVGDDYGELCREFVDKSKHRSRRSFQEIENNKKMDQEVDDDERAANLRNAKMRRNKMRSGVDSCFDEIEGHDLTFPSRRTSYIDGEIRKEKPPKEERVVELKIGGRESIIHVPQQQGEDEPPFNFQACLRKTEVTRSSLKRERFQQESAKSENYFTAELSPGIKLEGMVYSL